MKALPGHVHHVVAGVAGLLPPGPPERGVVDEGAQRGRDVAARAAVGLRHLAHQAPGRVVGDEPDRKAPGQPPGGRRVQGEVLEVGVQRRSPVGVGVAVGEVEHPDPAGGVPLGVVAGTERRRGVEGEPGEQLGGGHHLPLGVAGLPAHRVQLEDLAAEVLVERALPVQVVGEVAGHRRVRDRRPQQVGEGAERVLADHPVVVGAPRPRAPLARRHVEQVGPEVDHGLVHVTTRQGAQREGAGDQLVRRLADGALPLLLHGPHERGGQVQLREPGGHRQGAR